jgi:hypothetical protein
MPKNEADFDLRAGRLLNKEDDYPLRDGQTGYGYGNTGPLNTKNSFHLPWPIV